LIIDNRGDTGVTIAQSYMPYFISPKLVTPYTLPWKGRG